MGASTPHFALQLRNRIQTLIANLPHEHPARVEGEREIARLDRLAWGSERRGPIQPHEEGLPSFPPEAEEDGASGHGGRARARAHAAAARAGGAKSGRARIRGLLRPGGAG